MKTLKATGTTLSKTMNETIYDNNEGNEWRTFLA